MSDLKKMQAKQLAEAMLQTGKGKHGERYERFKALLALTEESPDAVYPLWDTLAPLIDPDSSHKFEGIHILANLAGVDAGGKFEKIIERFLALLEDESFIVALNAANTLGLIAKEKINLEPQITSALLATQKTAHKHPDLLMSGAVLSFGKYYGQATEKERILAFVKNLVSAQSPKAKKVAKDFLRKWCP